MKKAKKSDGTWVEGNFVTDLCGSFILPNNSINQRLQKISYYGYEIIEVKAFEVDETTKCDYTGYSDCKANKIFQNDIIRYNAGYEENNPTGIIIWENGAWNIKWMRDEQMSDENLRSDLHFWVTQREIEVVGNIFDNPKNEALKPEFGKDLDGNEYAICRECSAIISDGIWFANYCPDCGKKVDWSV